MKSLRYCLMLLLSISSMFSNAQSKDKCQLDFFKTVHPKATVLSVDRLDKPDHCRLQAKINERISKIDNKNYAIGFEMRFPANWNQRFLFQGNGGNDGRLVPALGSSANHSESALSKGFAVISTDAGHRSQSLLGGASFGLDPKARLNYGYQANQTLTPIAKTLLQQFYPQSLQHSYFMGCSNGGRQAMVAASRLASEFDGFIAGNPGFNLPKAAVQHAWDVQVLSSLNADISRSISQNELDLLSNAVLTACDALDGLEDGMVQATSLCQNHFDLQILSCTNKASGACLSEKKLEAFTKLFSGPVNSKGEKLYSNWPFDTGVKGADWQRWKIKSPIANLPMIATLGAGSLADIFQTPPEKINATPPAFLEYLRQFDFDDDANKIYASNDIYTESSMEFMTPPDASVLNELKNSGSKLLVYHGASDGVFSVNDTINWYQSLSKNHQQQADQFARLYVVPGMNHCSGGPATDQFDVLSVMQEWVENKIPPQSIVARVNSKNAELPENWSEKRSRPLCPYPSVAVYNGVGDIEKASSFSCQTLPQ